MNARGASPFQAGIEPIDAAAPMVSVIVTNHNYGRFLECCLKTILDQSYPKIECIVVDDASSDDSCAVLDRFMQSQIFAVPGRSLQAIKLSENLGMIGAARAGFERSTGQYVIFFDADDYMLPHLVEAHITAFFYSRYAVAVSSTDMFVAQGGEHVMSAAGGLSYHVSSNEGQAEPFSRKTQMPVALSRAGFEPKFELALSELHHLPRERKEWRWGTTSALCFRREMLEPMFKRTPKLNGCLDRYLLYGIHPFTGSILIDRPLVVYRLHGANDWSMFPRIEGFINWDVPRQEKRQRTIAHETMETLLLSADFYAKFLYDDDVFLRAVEAVYFDTSNIFSGMPVLSMQEFLDRHEARLKSAFGEATYARWVYPYRPVGRIMNLIRRTPLLRSLYAGLRVLAGEAGVARLRAMVQR